MKNTLRYLLMLAFSLTMFNGCSNESQSPVTAPTTVDETPEFITLPKRLTPSLQKKVVVTRFMEAAQGGTLQLHDSYVAEPDGRIVTIDIALEIKPHDLPYDASISLAIDDVAFLTSVDLTFGPHGIAFSNPVKLTVAASGLDLNLGNGKTKLYYLSDNGNWKTLGKSGGRYEGGTLNAEGMLTHFSQYAFGR